MMLRHWLKLVWQRKARYGLLVAELSLAFAVVFAIAAIALRQYQLQQLPLGFVYEDVWAISLNKPMNMDGKVTDQEALQQLQRSLKAMPQINGVSYSHPLPYTDSTWSSNFRVDHNGADVTSDLIQGDDDFAQVMQLQLVAGRFFSTLDDGQNDDAILISEHLAMEAFGAMNPVGQTLSTDGPDESQRRHFRVVGVITDYRYHGEIAGVRNAMIVRNPLQALKRDPQGLLLKMRADSSRQFESELNRQLRQMHPDWSFSIDTLPAMRSSKLHLDRIPLLLFALVAAFLLLMVAFGLFGVLWQQTAQRTAEIGLRRALGAIKKDIYSQIVAEQCLLSAMAILPALLLLAQLPLLHTFGEELSWGLFVQAVAVAAALLFALGTVCALYPAWRAARLSPVLALRSE